MIGERILEQLCAIGRDLYVVRIISSHGGDLKPNDLMETGLKKNDSGVVTASTELCWHIARYTKSHPCCPLFATIRAW